MGRDLLNEAARLSQLFYSLAFHFLFLPPFAHCSAEAHGDWALARLVFNLLQCTPLHEKLRYRPLLCPTSCVECRVAQRVHCINVRTSSAPTVPVAHFLSNG